MEQLKPLQPTFEIFVASFLWASAVVGIRIVYVIEPSTHPATFGFFRSLVTTIILTTILVGITYQQHRNKSHQSEPHLKGNLLRKAYKDARILLIPGTASGLVYTLQYIAQIYTTAGKTSLLMALHVFFTAIFSVILLRDKITTRQLFGIILGFSGATLLTIDPYNLEEIFTSGYVIGDILAILGAMFWGLYNVTIKQKLPPETGAIKATTHVFLFTTITMMPFLLLPIPSASPFPNSLLLSPTAIVGGILLSLFGSVGAFFFWHRGIKGTSATTASLYLTSIPIFSILLESILLREPITNLIIIGSSIIIVGTLLNIYK